MWVSLKPGAFITRMHFGDLNWHPGVIHSVSGGTFTQPTTEWTFKSWSLRYNGKYLGRELKSTEWTKFDGEAAIASTIRFIDMDKDDDEQISKSVKHGQIYWDLLHKRCKYFCGPSGTFPFNHVSRSYCTQDFLLTSFTVDGLVMTDLISYYAEDINRKPTLMDNSDCRNWTSSCTCSVCKVRDRDLSKEVVALFDEYNYITVQGRTRLNRRQYFLCPFEIPSFIFRTRTWGIICS
jgi:hypothetical protein